MKIKPSQINGVGLFPDRDYAPNEEITDFTKNYTDSAWINHSCTPTCYLKSRERLTDVLYAGEKGLKREEEITVDYVNTGYTELWERGVKGHCTCPKCIEENRVEIYCRTYKSPEVEWKCVRAIIENTTDWPYKLVLWDASHEDAHEARMWNKAIRESTCNYIVFIDNDTEVGTSWLKRMMEVFKTKDDVGMVVPRTNLTMEHAQMNAKENDSISEVGMAGTFCLLFKKTLVEKVGWYDTDFYWYGSDIEFCHRVLKSGLKIYLQPKAFVYHIGSYSTDKAVLNDGFDIKYDEEKCKELFNEKTKN